MDWGGLVPVVHVLVWLHGAWAHVEPPTNVSFHCHNLHNVLKWNYNQVVPGLRFKVFIGSKIRPPEERWVDPPARHIDVSFLCNPEDDYFMMVSAVVGGNESTAMPPDGLSFSYFKYSVAKQKCMVDLPSVNVTAQRDASVVLRFGHPWLLYHEKLNGASNLKHRKRSGQYKPQIEEPLPEFSYVVTIDQKPHNFICAESVCEGTLPVDSKQRKHCLTIVGELENMSVRGTQLYCAEPYKETPEPPWYIYVALILLSIGVALAFVIFMVYWKRTRPSSRLTILPFRSNHPPIFMAQPAEITVPEVEPASPTPLLCDEENNEISATFTSESTGHRLPIGITEGEEEFVVVNGEEGNNEEVGYTGGMDLDDFSSGYESRPGLDNSRPDDRAEG